MRDWRRYRRVFTVAVLALPLFAAPAGATVTIGQIPSSTPPAICTGGPADLFQFAVSSGTGYVVPQGYTTITSWTTNAAAGAGQTLKLKVYRLVSGTTYLVVTHDGPRALVPSTTNTFAVHIAVQGGDFVGLNDQNAPSANNACLFQGASGDMVAPGPNTTDNADGSTQSMSPVAASVKVNVSATVAAPPGVASMSPTSGSIAGGTPVVITGHDFMGATAVSFGATPAKSFTVNSDTQITATSPPHSTPGAVDVAVSAPAGTTPVTSSDRFTYTACVVPKLKGNKLKQAKAALQQANCAIGKVKHKKHHKGKKPRKVKSQSPKIGTILPPGSQVSIKLN